MSRLGHPVPGSGSHCTSASCLENGTVFQSLLNRGTRYLQLQHALSPRTAVPKASTSPLPPWKRVCVGDNCSRPETLVAAALDTPTSRRAPLSILKVKVQPLSLPRDTGLALYRWSCTTATPCLVLRVHREKRRMATNVGTAERLPVAVHTAPRPFSPVAGWCAGGYVFTSGQCVTEFYCMHPSKEEFSGSGSSFSNTKSEPWHVQKTTAVA